MTTHAGPRADSDIQLRADLFIKTLYLYVAGGILILGLFLIVLDVAFNLPLSYLAVSASMSLISAASHFLARKDRLTESGVVLLGGISVMMLTSIYLSPNLKGEIAAGISLIVVLAGFTIGHRFCVALGLIDLVLYALAYSLSAPDAEGSSLLLSISVPLATIVIFTITVFFISNHTRDLRTSLSDRLSSIEDFIPRITESGSQLASAAQEIHVLADQQRQGASQQSAAVSEIRQSLQSLLDASVKIADVAKSVRTNAEATLQNSQEVASRINALATQTSRITEIVETIRDIANKSELLALNAALEGTKAGEVGQGFSLVAAQMQRLTESIMASLRGIRDLTRDIQQDTSLTQTSIVEATRLAQGTTEASHEIAFITQQQRSSTEQITNAMRDITVISKQVAEGSAMTLESTERLHEFASHLPTLLENLKSSSRQHEPGPAAPIASSAS